MNETEKQIVAWLRSQVVAPPQIKGPFICAFLWAFTHPFQFGKQWGRIKFAAEAACAIERGEHSKREKE